MLYISGARRMHASGGGFSSGGGTSLCSSLQPLAGAKECEGFLLELGKPGHCSACSLANQAGVCHDSLVAFLVSPWCRSSDPVAVNLTCHGGCPCPSHLLVPLPRGFGWVHHAALARSCGPVASSSSSIWKAVQFGTALSCSGGWTGAPLSIGRVVLHPERVSVPPVGGGWFSEWRLEGQQLGQGGPGPSSTS